MAQLNLHHLRLFRAVASDGTLTGAARGLNLSQSALSTQLKTLEASLGQDLFERRGRGLVLTEARRALRVGALATLSRNFQMQFLRPLIGRADVEVVLRSGSQEELLRGLEALALDVMLTNAPPVRDATTHWLVHRLDEQPVSLIGTRARVGPVPPPLKALLAMHPLIVPTRETGLRTAFDALAARLQVTPIFAAEVDDMAMIRLLARADAGLAIIPPIVVRDELTSGALVEASRLDGIGETFFAVTRERRFPNPLLADVLPG